MLGKINIIKVRAVLTTLLIVVTLIVIFTGIGLHLAPIGRIAKATGWAFFGLGKESLEKLHTVTGFLMAFLILIHFSINFELYKSEMRQLLK